MDKIFPPTESITEGVKTQHGAQPSQKAVGDTLPGVTPRMSDLVPSAEYGKPSTVIITKGTQEIPYQVSMVKRMTIHGKIS